MTVTDPSGRCADAWATLRSCLARAPAGQLVVKDGPGRGARLAALWPFGQALNAAVAVLPHGLSDVESVITPLLRTMERYRSGHGYGPFPGDRTRYYDDNAWIALDLLQLDAVAGDDEHLDQVVELFELLAEGEAPDGGVLWVEGQRSRNTCSTAPSAQVAAHLFLRTGQHRYLDFAVRQMRFLDETLRTPAGLYQDNVDHNGAVEPTIWSYNQGTPIGAAVLLARATDDDAWVDRARRTAQAAHAHFTAGDGWWRQPPVFNAVHFRNVLALLAVAPDDELLRSLDRYLDRVVTDARSPRSGLFVEGGIGSYDGRPTIDQAGLTQLLAFRTWPPERWSTIC